MVHVLRTARVWSLFNHAGAYERGRTESAKGLMIMTVKFDVVWMLFPSHLNLFLSKWQSTVCPDSAKPDWWDVPASCVGTGSSPARCLFGKMSITQCKIWGEILMLILGANNLVYCVTLLIFLSFSSHWHKLYWVAGQHKLFWHAV